MSQRLERPSPAAYATEAGVRLAFSLRRRRPERTSFTETRMQGGQVSANCVIVQRPRRQSEDAWPRSPQQCYFGASR